ncbi:hypothetical protein [Sporisorium scitamineum]|uniref:Uncharacterized protein n=1 Tax=Sporisorium scitamineum TaxID=49012 RepID=A0A0F7SA47_9BASI|nr:hypothetical protein [Sporisorium scitamineum]
MPMEAIHLLSAAEPHMPSVEELKQLAGAARPWLQNRDMYKANVEESESNNQAILWATLQQDDASLAQKVQFEEPIDMDELQHLQHLLPVKNSNPNYVQD